MSGVTLRAVMAAVFFVHGIGHFMGVMPALRIVDVKGWNSHSWLLTPMIGETASRVLSAILFLAALAGFILAALSLLGWLLPHDWWRTLAVASSALSLVTIVLFWNAFVALVPNKVGAIGVDIAVLICLLVMGWPSEVDIGY